MVYRKIISCTNVTKKETIAEYLFKTKCKWGTQPPSLGLTGSKNVKSENGLRAETTMMQ
jgi:hypothetical protein